MALETIVGPLSETIHQVDLATVQTAAQITTARRDNPGNSSLGLGLAADSVLYRVEDKRPVLYLGKGDTNLIFRNPTEAIDQIRKTGNYRPSKDEIEFVLDSKTVKRFELFDLSLVNNFRDNELENEYAYKTNQEFACFDIESSKPHIFYDLNESQRKFAEEVYGAGDDFTKNMEMLRNGGRQPAALRVYVLNPTYVIKNAKDSALVRVCMISNDFNASNRTIDASYLRLRAERKPVTEDKK